MQQLPEALMPLSAYRQFILWTPEERNGKTVKLPIDHRTGKVGNAHDSGAWLDAETAISLAKTFGPNHGVGFVFTKSDPFFFLDIDNCLAPNGRTWLPIVDDLTKRLPGTAVEISQSGKGLHIFGQYSRTAPEHACKNIQQGLELYTEGRFVALTGDEAIGSAGVDCTANLASVVSVYFPPNVKSGSIATEWTNKPVSEYTGPADDDELIKKMLSAKQSARSAFGGSVRFKALWVADEDV